MTNFPWVPITLAGKCFFDAVCVKPEKTLIALDFDGTLSQIVPDPKDARMYEGAATALARLAPKIAKLAIISGREVDMVRKLGKIDYRAGLENLTILGQYGVERYDVATGKYRIPEISPVIAEVEKALVALLDELGTDVAGVRLENKGRAIGVHTRQADHPQRSFELLTKPVKNIADRYGVHLEPGRLVLELRQSNLSKADALQELLNELKPEAVAMVGDDLGDLPAFQLLHQLRSPQLSCCAVVSSSAEQSDVAEFADVLCAGPPGVADWLDSLASELT
ncbi:MAG: trehalose-phosphatase [Propionibacterium sp.]|nr:MAG: trehalose-phosphatase [Propionibacterium sp.]